MTIADILTETDKNYELPIDIEQGYKIGQTVEVKVIVHGAKYVVYVLETL